MRQALSLGCLPAERVGLGDAQVITVRLHSTVLHVFFAGQLVRTVPRCSTGEVVVAQLRVYRPHRPSRQPMTN